MARGSRRLGPLRGVVWRGHCLCRGRCRLPFGEVLIMRYLTFVGIRVLELWPVSMNAKVEVRGVDADWASLGGRSNGSGY